jgi:hypothetical protein
MYNFSASSLQAVNLIRSVYLNKFYFKLIHIKKSISITNSCMVAEENMEWNVITEQQLQWNQIMRFHGARPGIMEMD